MSDYLKTPLARSLNALAEKKAAQAIQATGRSLPCSVVSVVSSGIVTVQFEVNAAPFTLSNVTVPVAMSGFVRFPTPAGTKGVVMAADARLGGVTGLGAGIASLDQPANLTALYFVPLGNTAWEDVDPDVVVINADGGAIIRDTTGAATITLTPSSIALEIGSSSITLDGSHVDLNGTLRINGSLYTAHKHSGVQTGGSNSGGVVP